MPEFSDLNELLDYGEEFKYPDLIMSDYFRLENREKDLSQPEGSNPNSATQNQASEEPDQDSNLAASSSQETSSKANAKDQEQTSESKSSSSSSIEKSPDLESEKNSSKENGQLKEHSSTDKENEEKKDSKEELPNQDTLPKEEQEDGESGVDTEKNDQSDQKGQEKDQIDEDEACDTQEESKSKKSLESQEDSKSKGQIDKEGQKGTEGKSSGEKQDKTGGTEKKDADREEQPSSPSSPENTSPDSKNKPAFEEQEPKEENDFDDLLENYDSEKVQKDNSDSPHSGKQPSSKLSEIRPTEIYRVLKKLVSLSYERYQKGTYRYNKKEIVKHYLTNQKFRIIDDLESPTYKPDVYVFDLSPSNNQSLSMYVNAISSLAVKGSIIYLTFNERILRKIEIKKSSSTGIDVDKVANSEVQKYQNFDCTVFKEYQTIYQELVNIKNRKIYIFSDFDISREISQLSIENSEIVWFSTERINSGTYWDPFRTYPSTYAGYYIETTGIKDIERYILEKNKQKYKRRP